MDRFVVACVQQRLRLPSTFEEYRDQLRRFLRAAEAKRARLVVFPELAGVMVAPPLLGDFRSSLLKRADRGQRSRATLWQKVIGAAAGGAAGMLKANLQTSLSGLLDVDAQAIWQRYQEIHGGLARDFGLTIVAPSAYLPDPLDGVIRHLAAVYGPNGELLGVQAKVMLSQDDQIFCQPGSTWDVIQTEVGALGVMVGSDVMYPEVGRLLAFQGAEVLVAQAACPNTAYYNKLRSGILARMQDNQLFAVSACLVGTNVLKSAKNTPFMGKSALFAPQELTPRFNGVLVEMGNFTSEGVLTAEWNFVGLKDLWEKSDTPVRQQLPLKQASQMLIGLYKRLQSLPRLETGEPAAGMAEQTLIGPARLISTRPTVGLDDLPVIASVKSRWPPNPVPVQDALTEEAVNNWGRSVANSAMEDKPTDSVAAPVEPPAVVQFEEETDEMDALADSDKPAS